ncbi:hypothetical protein [Streptomyces sp. NPDC049555]|uniref:hypothetical protein n=1 Tax=unclassified Streptomyces TaxID=2593676 RepID=UPI0034461DE6
MILLAYMLQRGDVVLDGRQAHRVGTILHQQHTVTVVFAGGRTLTIPPAHPLHVRRTWPPPRS